MPSLRVVIAGNDYPPVDISLSPEASIEDLKNAVFRSYDSHISPSSHRLRFVVAGKNLSPNTPTLQQAGLTDGTFVHCAVSAISTSDHNPLIYQGGSFLHCDHDDGLVTIDLGAVDIVDDISEDGSLHDWCWGFVLGALLGLIMMILAMDRSIALSGKWKKGIGCGTVVNIFFGIFLLANDRLS